MYTFKDLEQIRNNKKADLVTRSVQNESNPFANIKPTYKRQILICGGTGCTSGGSKKIFEALKEGLKKTNIEKETNIIMTGCFGLCAKGPLVVIYPECVFYQQVSLEDVDEIINAHLINGQLVTRLMHNQKDQDGNEVKFTDTPFYKKQLKIALRNCGHIDPENIDEYLAYGGYKAYEKVVTSMTEQQVIDEIKASGLRGRGGGGFSTGTKWQFCHDSTGKQKYVVCNADEGDPGAFMDRSVLEGNPHSILEAMMIAGYAIGANQGYIYVRAEYPIAVERLKIAIDQARKYNILGNNVLGTDRKFDIDLRLGAGAFVCGEETALLASIEGRRGEPRQRPPFPAVSGLFGCPTLINNVETYATITYIINNGAKSLNKIGTEKSKGTKVFALGGKIVNTGLCEVPMGTTLKTIIEEIGGGVPNGKKFKAAQTGGPSGGCIPAEHIDTEIDYDNLIKLGSMMGSGGLIVMDEDNCMVDIAKFFLEFTVDESCGKCTPCRIGNKRLLEMLDKVISGKGTIKDLDEMEKLCIYIKENSLCGLGQTAPNPVLSTLKYFRDEYEAHVVEKRCPAKVCKKLMQIFITDKCIGCTACAKICPVSCIKGEPKKLHVIDQSRCIKCGACMSRCPVSAIIKK